MVAVSFAMIVALKLSDVNVAQPPSCVKGKDSALDFGKGFGDIAVGN